MNRAAPSSVTPTSRSSMPECLWWRSSQSAQHADCAGTLESDLHRWGMTPLILAPILLGVLRQQFLDHLSAMRWTSPPALGGFDPPRPLLSAQGSTNRGRQVTTRANAQTE